MTRAAANMIAYLQWALAFMTCLCILLAGIVAALLWDRGVIGAGAGFPRFGRRATGAEGRARG